MLLSVILQKRNLRTCLRSHSEEVAEVGRDPGPLGPRVMGRTASPMLLNAPAPVDLTPESGVGRGVREDGGELVPRLRGVTDLLLPPDRGEGLGGQRAEGAVFRPRALVLDPTSLPRRLGAHHGPADLHHPGLAGTPGHLVRHWGRREGPSPHLNGYVSVSSLLPASSRSPVPPAAVPAALEKLQPHRP